jgi:enoyl-CoA hydratase/carnithine racemase
MATDYSDYEFLNVEVAERVATITINRPDSLNAMEPLYHRLNELCRRRARFCIPHPRHP